MTSRSASCRLSCISISAKGSGEISRATGSDGMANAGLTLVSGSSRPRSLARDIGIAIGRRDRFRRNIAPWRQPRHFAGQPAENHPAGIAHRAKIEIGREGGGENLGLLDGFAVFRRKFPPTAKGFFARFVFAEFSQNTPNLSPAAGIRDSAIWFHDNLSCK